MLNQSSICMQAAQQSPYWQPSAGAATHRNCLGALPCVVRSVCNPLCCVLVITIQIWASYRLLSELLKLEPLHSTMMAEFELIRILSNTAGHNQGTLPKLEMGTQ